MGWLDSLSQTLRAERRTAPEPYLTRDRLIWLPSKDLGGMRMTADDALRLSVVWACVTVTAKALASCEWDVFLQLENGDRLPRRRLVTYALLNDRPNRECTAFAFREAMYIQAMIYGDFYAEIEFDRGGRPVALWPLDYDRCTLERDADGELVLVVRNRDGGDVALPYESVLHIHGPGVDGLTGFNVVTLAARSLAHAAAAEAFGASFYHNGTQFGGLLSFPNKLSNEARQQMTESIKEGRKGSKNAWDLLVLDNGAKYESFGVEPDKAQFIETRHLLIEEVCRWFGVPPHKVAHLLRSTFSNIEHQSIEFVRDALTPWAERGRQEVDFKLLRPWPGIRSRLGLEWLQEGDAKSKAEVDSIEVQNGLVTRNEARRRRGRNSIGSDGDKLTVQVNMTTLDKVGADMAAPDPAVALFRLAMTKAMRRRARVATEAAAAALDPDALLTALRRDEGEHSRYLAHLVKECLDTLELGRDQPAMRAALAAAVDEDTALLCRAYEAGDLEAWCNVDERAAATGRVLAGLLDS